MQRDQTKVSNTSHGKSSSRVYMIWKSMVARCKPDHPDRHLYFDQGIRVCERWLTFENFYADVGDPPEGAEIDRFPDKSGNYEPSNWRWATEAQQARNTAANVVLTYLGTSLCVGEWAERMGIKANTISARLRYGWTVEEALTVPVNRGIKRAKRLEE